MKTINTVLPVYNRLEKQLYYRAKADEKGIMAMMVTPRYRLPSMQWNVSEDCGPISTIKLVNIKTAVETSIQSYFLNERLLRPSTGVAPVSDLPTNTGYDVFTDYVGEPEKFAIQKTTAPGVAYVETCSFPIYTGQSMVVRFTSFTLTSGTPPEVVIVDSTGTDISNVVRISDTGTGYFALTATETDLEARVHFRNLDGEQVNMAVTYYLNSVTLPGYHTELTETYFQYDGENLAVPLPEGRFYLKFTTINNYIYYSEVFEVPCVYPKLITSWTNSDNPLDYETFNSSGTSIVSAINTVDEALCYSDQFTAYKEEVIYASFYLTLYSGDLPVLILNNVDTGETESYTLSESMNVITMTAPSTGTYLLYLYNTTNTSYNTFEVLVYRAYSEKYIRLNFSNSCDIGDLVYQNGWTQSLWIESEPMEMTFPQEDKGIENGEGKFIRTFARQVKKYLLRTKELPDYMVELFNRMKLHDTVEIIDLVGDTNDVYNLEVEHEWLWDDRYYAKCDLTFDYDEVFVINGCCNNLT